MLYPKFLRPPDRDPVEFEKLFREAVHLFSLYHDAGFPYGRSPEGLKLWFEHGRTARPN